MQDFFPLKKSKILHKILHEILHESLVTERVLGGTIIREVKVNVLVTIVGSGGSID